MDNNNNEIIKNESSPGAGEDSFCLSGEAITKIALDFLEQYAEAFKELAK